MGKTTENLELSFAGESQACIRYLAFAEKAEKEGYVGAAKLFRAAAKAEMYHALSHLRALGVVAETAANLADGPGRGNLRVQEDVSRHGEGCGR